MLLELALGDVGMRLKWMPVACTDRWRIEGAEVAAIPGAAEQGRELATGAPEGLQDGGKLFREGEEAAVRDGRGADPDRARCK